MIRHDEHYLQLIHKHVSLEKFSYIQNLPFFFLEMPEKWMISPTQANLNILKELLPTDEITIGDMLPFDEFSFVMVNDPSLHVVKLDRNKNILYMYDYFLPRSYNYSGMAVNEKHDSVIHKIKEDPNYPPLGSHQRKVIDRGVWVHAHARTITGFYSVFISQHYRRKQKFGLILDDKVDKDSALVRDRNDFDMESLILSVLALFVTAEEKHEYLVEVTRDPTHGLNKRGKHHPSKYSPKHHYVYLDGPPVTSLTDGEQSELTRRGHARKAHWHRLMHDRFRNHPNFGGRIRIRATWIGPKEWADAGKIYTLHEPETL